MNSIIANSVVVLTFLVLLQLHGESNAEALATHLLKHNLLNKLHHHYLEKHTKNDHDKHKYNEQMGDHPKHLPPPSPSHPPIKNPASKEHISGQKLPPSVPHLPPSVDHPLPKPPIPLPNNPFSIHGAPPKHPLPHSYPQPGQGPVQQNASDKIGIEGDGNSINKLLEVDTNINIPITIEKD